MARSPDARVVKARELFDQGLKLIEIANTLEVSEGTVRSWKSRYKWDNATLQKPKRNVAKPRGGQIGNRNAVGNRGGAAPQGNKNALKTGEFETLFFDTLKEDEKLLIGLLRPDKEALLLQEIRLFTVREHRMLERIEEIRGAMEMREDGSQATGFTVTKMKIGLEKGKDTNLKEYEGKLGQIQAIEDALTRVQARKQRAIDALHRYGIDDARLEIELRKLEILEAKNGLDEEEEAADDGFLEALNQTAAEDWADEEENQ